MIKKCKQCGAEYKDRPSRRVYFCSRTCMGKYKTGKKRPSYIGKLISKAKTGVKRTASVTKEERINRRNGAIKAGCCPPNATGRKASLKTRLKESKLHMGNKNPMWKGGVTPKNKKIRQSIEHRLWREAVFARDNWVCQKCNNRGGKLHSHHILNFAEYEELRFAIDNGITLCISCHNKFHKKYGFKNNTKEQILTFINLRNSQSI